MLQYSCLENAMDRGAWQATVHGVTKSQTGLNMHAHALFYLQDLYKVLGMRGSCINGKKKKTGLQQILQFSYYLCDIGQGNESGSVCPTYGIMGYIME